MESSIPEFADEKTASRIPMHIFAGKNQNSHQTPSISSICF